MGMIQSLPKEGGGKVYSSADNISSKVATLGLQGIVDEVEETIKDKNSAYADLELPVEF